MRLQLRPALEADRAFCESLHRSNMASYRSARGIAWDPDRFLANWAQFENLVISVDDQRAGLLRLLVVDGALEIRDLQLVPEHRGHGIGAWAVAEVKAMAASRGIGELRLRVYAENPAQRLYIRLGFKVDATDGSVVHMSHALRPRNAAADQPRKPLALGGAGPVAGDADGAVALVSVRCRYRLTATRRVD